MARNAVDALARALRLASPGDGLLAATLADVLDDVAEQFDVDPAWLGALDVERPDGRAELARVVAAVRDRRAGLRAVAALDRRAGVAEKLIAAALWSGSFVELPPAALFSIASSAKARVLRLETPAFAVHVNRSLLVRARPILTRFDDLTASLDAEALHLRWRDGRGALHHRCSPPAPRDELAFVVRFGAPRAARPPALLVDVLRDLDLIA